jgi:hypothetical protein
MKKLIAIAGATASLAVGIPALASSGPAHPLGVRFSNLVAYAYSYCDYMHSLTITTSGQDIYNVQYADPSFPGPGWRTLVAEVPAHSSVTLVPPSGAWYIDPHTILDLPVTYQDAAGNTYSTDMFGTYAICAEGSC